ncbi:MAG: hypothetical protein SFW67_12920 [Myxococcaceae bacterium]|nr:hypothetical protein [Myxococcaceae bacterium]
MTRKRIGELLLERQVLTKAQLEAGLAAQKRTRQRLGITLIQQGVLSEAQLAGALAASLGVPAVDLSRVQVDWSAVHMLRARFCENHEVFPFGIDGKGTTSKRLVVAMADPLNQAALDEIGFTTGLTVSPCVATHSQAREAILRYYHKVTGSAAVLPAASGSPGGATVRLIPSPVDEDEPVVMGEEIISINNPLPPDVATPAKAESQPKKRLDPALAKDLGFLFGERAEGEDLETLERRFWALLRALSKKGLLTREEFLAELGDE